MVEETHPRVGIGIMIMKDDKVLLGKRKGSHGAGEYAFPGGHLEYMESYEECVLREIEEECGVKIHNLRFLLLANIKDYAPKHYVHIGFLADWESGEPEVREPEKCEGWGWYDLDALPEPLFRTIPDMLDAYHNGVYYRDSRD
jgi:8-oxo-dGTP diphosphatase